MRGEGRPGGDREGFRRGSKMRLSRTTNFNATSAKG